jgi:hypothetical protein
MSPRGTVFFVIWTELLNIISVRFGFKGLTDWNEKVCDTGKMATLQTN